MIDYCEFIDMLNESYDLTLNYRTIDESSHVVLCSTLLLGYDVKKAIEIANEVNPYCGGDIVQYKVNKNVKNKLEN